MLTGKRLAEYCEKVYKAGWVYWYGTYGQKCSTSLYNKKKAQYPAHYTAKRAAGYQKDIAAGKRCADCVGMIKSFFWTGGVFGSEPKYGANHCPDTSANGMIKLCKETGPIKTIPDEPGLVVWKSGHIGVYIGGGYTIEMRGFDYDCVKRKVSAGPWTKWGRLPAGMISYDGNAAPSTEQLPQTSADGLCRGDYGSAVEAMQKALLTWKADCLPKHGADGDFGSETEEALKAYQSAQGLPVTGVYDAISREALASNGKFQYIRITGGAVNVRSAPDLGARVLGVAHKRDKLPYQGQSKTDNTGRTWFLVEFDGQNGWVSEKYAEVCK